MGAGVPFGAVASLAFLLGGYYATAWGWAALALGWVAALALILRTEIRVGPLDTAAAATLIAFVTWIAASTIWSLSVTDSMLEVERALVYIAGMLAALLVATEATPLLIGVAAASGVVTSYALATRLFPGVIRSYDATNAELATPIGYSNALGLFAALGALLCFGFAARARHPLVRSMAAAALVVFVVTIYLSFGRATWLALAVGIAAAIAVDPRRSEAVIALAALAPPCAIAAWLASRAHGLTHQHVLRSEAAHDGHRLAAALLVLGVLAAMLGWTLGLIDWSARRWRPLRLCLTAALIGASIWAVGFGVMRYGNPLSALKNGYDNFKAQPSPSEGNLNRRLLSFSGDWRQEYWPVAWQDVKAHPALGSGAGTYELYWLQHRRVPLNVRDAHNLYLEVLAELGGFGLALLLAVLAVPLVAAVRARGHPFVPAALGAFVAYLVHAGLQWDWELPAVTLAALFSGAAMIVAARRKTRRISTTQRIAALLVSAVACGSAAFGLVGNVALANSARAAREGEWSRAAEQAHKAERWAPWSSEPLRWLGEAQLAVHDETAARATLRRAIGRDPRNWELWFGLALASRGHERRAALARASMLNPLSPELEVLRTRR